eukprot:3239070-Amphidinium_carterae.1
MSLSPSSASTCNSLLISRTRPYVLAKICSCFAVVPHELLFTEPFVTGAGSVALPALAQWACSRLCKECSLDY